MEHAILRAAVSFAAGLALTACAAPAAEELPTLLPQPRETVWKSGSYRLPERVRIGYDSPGLAATAGYLAEALAPYATATTAEGEGDITLSTDTASLAEEAYRLSVSRPGVRITAGSPRGAANGIATLRQLLPPGAVRVDLPPAREQGIRCARLRREHGDDLVPGAVGRGDAPRRAVQPPCVADGRAAELINDTSQENSSFPAAFYAAATRAATK